MAGGGVPQTASDPGLVGARSLENLLHDERVHPAAVQASLLPVDSDLAEARAPVRAHARRIPREGREDELVVAELARPTDERLQEAAPHAAAAPVPLDVEREVGHVRSEERRVGKEWECG